MSVTSRCSSNPKKVASQLLATIARSRWPSRTRWLRVYSCSRRDNGPRPVLDQAQITSGITKEELPLVLDLFTTDAKERREGLVNISTADAVVLATLPGIDPALAETIVSTRGGLGADRRATIAWLFQEGIVDAARFKVIAPQITTGSHQFSFHVIGPDCGM